MTVLADFIFLGHQQTGSFALSSNKTELFAVAIGAFLDVICETFNKQAIPRLIDINGEHFTGVTDYPYMVHGDIEDADIEKVGTFIKDMTGIGVLVPDDDLEDFVRQVGHLPNRTKTYDNRDISEERRRLQNQNEPPEPNTAAGKDDNSTTEEFVEDVVEEAKKRLGRGG
jgi:phage gp29-like protein